MKIVFNTCYSLRTLCGRCQNILAAVIHEPGYRTETVGDKLSGNTADKIGH